MLSIGIVLSINSTNNALKNPVKSYGMHSGIQKVPLLDKRVE